MFEDWWVILKFHKLSYQIISGKLDIHFTCKTKKEPHDCNQTRLETQEK